MKFGSKVLIEQERHLPRPTHCPGLVPNTKPLGLIAFLSNQSDKGNIFFFSSSITMIYNSQCSNHLHTISTMFIYNISIQSTFLSIILYNTFKSFLISSYSFCFIPCRLKSSSNKATNFFKFKECSVSAYSRVDFIT